VIIVTAIYGDSGTAQLLIFSQVILSMQLPFAVIPLLWFVCDRQKMGEFVLSRPMIVLAWIVATLILGLNIKLLVDVFFS
jgi:manganese transport protein